MSVATSQRNTPEVDRELPSAARAADFVTNGHCENGNFIADSDLVGCKRRTKPRTTCIINAAATFLADDTDHVSQWSARRAQTARSSGSSSRVSTTSPTLKVPPWDPSLATQPPQLLCQLPYVRTTTTDIGIDAPPPYLLWRLISPSCTTCRRPRAFSFWLHRLLGPTPPTTIGNKKYEK